MSEHQKQMDPKEQLASFPCGPVAAKKHIRVAFRNSKDAHTTITNFQQSNSLHSMFAKAFRTKLDEEMDPSAPLDFLSHLGVSRHEAHTRVASSLRSAIEDEIQRMPIAPLTTSPDGTIKAPSTTGEAGHSSLLKLLKSSWLFRDVPELRPVLVTVLKRLGDHTPVPMLRRLGMKQSETNELKNADLVSQLGPHLQRLVWEVDWDAKVELVVSNSGKDTPSASEEELTFRGSTILADLIRSSVDSYVKDTTLVEAADLAFAGTVSERRFATKLRRVVGASKASEGRGKAVETRNTLASIGGITASKATSISAAGNNKDENTIPSSAVAVASIKETIGSRPKLLGATLDMLIAEHATKDTAGSTIIGGATNLYCSLLADVLLAFGKLPSSYEVLIIMTRILDTAVQSGTITDNALAQIQGCLRTIFRPSKSEQQLESPSKGGTKIKLSLKSPAKASTTATNSMFPDLPKDDSGYERKLSQRVVKKAIASMIENDPQVRSVSL